MESIIVEHAHRLAYAVLLLYLYSAAVSASGTATMVSQLQDVNSGLKTVASALGVLIIVYAGIKWVMADSPQERDDAKKTIIYVIVGLLVVANAKDIVDALYSPAT